MNNNEIDIHNDDNAYDSLRDNIAVNEGMRLLWTNNIDESEVVFRRHMYNDPRCATGYCWSLFIKALLTRSDKDMSNLVTTAWDLERTSTNYDKVVGTLLKADTYFIGAMGQFLSNSTTTKVKAAWNIRKSWLFYDEAKKLLDDDNVNIDMNVNEVRAWCLYGIGVFNIMCSLLPSSVLRVVQWIGFQGDRDKALKNLWFSYEQDCFISVLSAIIKSKHKEAQAWLLLHIDSFISILLYVCQQLPRLD